MLMMIRGKVWSCGGATGVILPDFKIEDGVGGVFIAFVLLFFLTGEWLGEGGSVPASSEINRFVMCSLRPGSIMSGAMWIGRMG